MNTHTKNMQVDLIHGPIVSSLLQFALPILLSSVFQQLYNTMDTVIVGHTLGDTALAAMGASMSIYELLIGFALGVGNGLAIVTARSYGLGDERMLKKSVAAALVIGVGVSAAIMILGGFGLYPLLELLQTPAEIMEAAYSYISTITLFVFVMFAYNLCAGLLRAIGNSVMPLVFLILSSILNVGLDLVFIRNLGMGIRGAAVATVIAQGVSVVLCLVYIYLKCPLLVPGRAHFVPDGRLYGEMLGQGFSVGFMNSIVSLGTVILQYGINNLGYLLVAGHTAARKLFMFTSMPVTSIGMAMNTFVSQNRGAGRPERIKKAVTASYGYSLLISLVMSGLMFLFAPGLVRLISGSSEPAVIDNGARYLQINAPFFVVLGMVISTRNALQAMGKKLLPLVSSIIELVGKILFVLVLIPRFAYTAVIFSEPVIWCFMAAQLLLVFYRDPYIKAVKKEEGYEDSMHCQ